jgi:beta,beta-carotene 9',10'-dioxygenase
LTSIVPLWERCVPPEGCICNGQLRTVVAVIPAQDTTKENIMDGHIAHSHLSDETAGIPEHQGAFKTLHDEVELPSLPVEGRFPAWLDGALLRNGPGMFEAGHDLLIHQFDGAAMFHRFGIRDGKVSYANRYYRSPMFEYIRANAALGHRTFGTANSETMQRMRDEAARDGEPAVNPSVAFAGIGGEIYATTDSNTIPVEIDPATLESKGLLVWDDVLQEQDCDGNSVSQWRHRGTTGHWHRHPSDHSAINYFVQPAEGGRPTTYNFFRVPAGQKKREAIASIATDASAFIHAFCVTERYIILPESPLRFDHAKLATGHSILDSLVWRPEKAMLLHVIDIAERKHVRTFEARASYVMHTINAYEDGDDVVLDMAVYDDGNHVWELALDPKRRPPGGLFTTARAPELRSHAYPYRYRLDMRNGQSTETCIAPVCVELPTVDYADRNGMPYRYAYATGIDDRPSTRFYNQISSFDLQTGDVRKYSTTGHYLGEPVFVPRPGRQGEADGVLLSVGLDSESACSYLLALEPTTLEPLAKARLPHAVPSGFHGTFVRSGQ